MKNYLPKILSLILTPALFFAVILCCDSSQAKMAEANGLCALEKNAKSASTCHHCKSGAPTKAENNCCVQQLQAEQPVHISFNLSETIVNYVSFDIFSVQPVVLKSKYNLAYLDGPPGPVSVTPRYIAFRSFRV